MNARIKYILFFVLFFCVHYFEGLPPVGSLSVAQLWKIPLLFVLLIYNILSIRKRFFFEKAGYLLAIEYMFSPETIIKPLAAIIRVTKQIPFLLFFGFWTHQYKGNPKTLETIMYTLAQYICLSSIPFLLKWLTPLDGYGSAESFGIKGLVYYSGVFGATHAAASYFCIAILVLIYGFMTGRFQAKSAKIFNASLILIALVSILKAYVRTGWLMLAVGMVCFLPFRKITWRQFTIVVTTLLLTMGSIYYLYNYNEAFYARLTGKNIFTQQGGKRIELQGSGRMAFWETGIKVWQESNIYQSLFGQGYTQVTEMNYKTTKMKVFSHNQFIDALAQNGLIGFLLLTLFNIGLYAFIRSKRGHPYQRLCWAMFWSNLVFSFFQNEMYFNYAIVFSLALALLCTKEKPLHVN